MRAAMEMVTKLHPLYSKMTIYDIFPMFKTFMGVKHKLSWDKFDKDYNTIRKRQNKYNPPKIKRDATEELDPIEMTKRTSF